MMIMTMMMMTMMMMMSDDARETSHLFQRISALIQRYNAVAFRGSFIEEDDDVSG